MRKIRLAHVFLFLLLTGETYDNYGNRWWTPFRVIGDILVGPSPLKLNGFWFIALFVLWRLRDTRASAEFAKSPMRPALAISAGAVLFWIFLGVVRGGADTSKIPFQTMSLLSGLLATALFAQLFRSGKDWFEVGQVVLAAALVRSVMGIIAWFNVLSLIPEAGRPNYVTSHADSVMFAGALLWCIGRVIETGKGIKQLLLSAPVLLTIIVLNNRRLVYADIAAGIVLLFLILPWDRRKWRMIRAGVLIAPFFAAYLVVGANAKGAAFGPARALMSMSDSKNDSSTQARVREDMNLISTATPQWLSGSGWGHFWIEYDTTQSVTNIYPLYPYMPHNSVLALLCFVGGLGFGPHWFPFHMAVFLAVRTYRRTKDRETRLMCGWTLTVVASETNQWLGDIGMGCLPAWLVTAVAMGGVARLYVIAQSETTASPSAKKKGPPTPPTGGTGLRPRNRRIEVEVVDVGPPAGPPPWTEPPKWPAS